MQSTQFQFPTSQSFIYYPCVGINTKPLGSGDKYPPPLAQALTPVLSLPSLFLAPGDLLLLFVSLAAHLK